jgi:hypothetical protein
MEQSFEKKIFLYHFWKFSKSTKFRRTNFDQFYIEPTVFLVKKNLGYVIFLFIIKKNLGEKDVKKIFS